MPLRKLKPITSATRFYSISTFEEITKTAPEKSLTAPLAKRGGRNHHGHITIRHRGGGHKRLYRKIDFKRDKHGVPGKVAAIEYDPNRSSRIALINYADGEKRYIIAPLGLSVGNVIESGSGSDIKIGNAMPLRDVPLGSTVYNVELKKDKGGQLARSAGTSVQVVAKEGNHAHLKLPSGEVRLIRLECMATIGQASNTDHEKISLGKAGRSRWLGRRPSVRGVAMNPVDHPLGGGEGKSAGGRHPCTPWGVATKGKKTRKVNKLSNKYIVRRKGKK